MIFGGLALAVVLGIFGWQLSVLPNLRFQIQSGLHNSLQTIADNAAKQLDEAYSQEILQGSQQMKKAVAPANFAQENLAAMRQEMLRISSAHPLANAWIATFPDSSGQRFRAYEYKQPSRYRKETAQLGSWREQTELSQFVQAQLGSLIQPYHSIDSFAATYWQNALDSSLSFVYNKAFNNSIFVGIPWFDQATDSLRGFLFCQTDAWHLDQVFVRDFFKDQFWAAQTQKEGLQRKHLQIGVMAGKGDKLVYNSIAYGAQEFEHTSALADINSWLSDYKVGLRFRGASVESVAESIYDRNLYMILAMFILLISFLALLFRSAVHLVRLSRLKTEFVANVSHEIKTPLASIRLATDTLKLGRAKTPEQQGKIVEIIDTETARLQYLIHNLLDFSQLESGQKKYKMETISLKIWWEQVSQFFQARVPSDLEIKAFSPANAAAIKLDIHALEQVFAILIDNARKYSKLDQRIILSAEIRSNTLRISVQDFGIGISRENRAIIFEKFVRLGNTDVHNVKGHGIGLSIARAILRDHNGKIGLNSQIGKGTTFYLELPLLKGATT